MGYDTEQWHDLFVAAAGAGAALAGLVFVAISINIDRILKLPGVPERAFQTVLVLLGVVVVCICGLIPQDISTLGIEVLSTGVLLSAGLVILGRTVIRAVRGHLDWMISRLALVVPGAVLYLVAGITLLVGAGGGLYWVVAGLLAGVMAGVLNGWVLLVEILR